MKLLTPERLYEEELLDAGEGTDDDVADSLIDLRRINRYFGGRKVIVQAIEACLKRTGAERISLLDVGTGSGRSPDGRCRKLPEP
jgi:hypothetical protein